MKSGDTFDPLEKSLLLLNHQQHIQFPKRIKSFSIFHLRIRWKPVKWFRSIDLDHRVPGHSASIESNHFDMLTDV